MISERTPQSGRLVGAGSGRLPRHAVHPLTSRVFRGRNLQPAPAARYREKPSDREPAIPWRA